MPFARGRGVRLYYEWSGHESAPVLVLNNGILMNTASWAPQAPLAASFRVLRYDCRGQGQSDAPDEPYSMAGHAEDLAALLDELGVERAHILGLSYGGEVAQAFALAHPGRVNRLVLADTVSEVRPELRLIVEGWRKAARSGDPDLFFLASAPWNFSPAFIASHGPILEAARARYRDLNFAAVARLCDAFLDVSFTRCLPRIGAPTCVIVGEADILKGLRYARVLHRGIPGSELHVIDGAGHASSWEAPARFNEIVLTFLR